MDADRTVRWATVTAVVAVAAVAAYVSYWHCVTVVTQLAEHGTIGHLYPVAIDGIIVAASMVLLDAARHGEPAPPLAWLLLAAGIAVTLAANVTYGAQEGLSSALWSAWPALAFVGCYELLMLLVRASSRRAAATLPDTAATAATKGDRVRDILKASPALAKEDVAALADASVRTVERVKKQAMNGSGK